MKLSAEQYAKLATDGVRAYARAMRCAAATVKTSDPRAAEHFRDVARRYEQMAARQINDIQEALTNG